MKQGRALQGVWVADAADRKTLETDPQRKAVATIVDGALCGFDWNERSDASSVEEFVGDVSRTIAVRAVRWTRQGEKSEYDPLTVRQRDYAAALRRTRSQSQQQIQHLYGRVRRGSVSNRPRLVEAIEESVGWGAENAVFEASWTLNALYGVAVIKAEETAVDALTLASNSFLMILELARMNKNSDHAVLSALAGYDVDKDDNFVGLTFDPGHFGVEDTPRGPGLIAKVPLLDKPAYRQATPGCPAQNHRGILLFSDYVLTNVDAFVRDAASHPSVVA